MTREPIPTYMCERMVKAVDDGASVAEVARRVDVSESAVWNFVHWVREGQSPEPKPRSGSPQPTRNDEDRPNLVDAVDADPDTTLEELIEPCDRDVSDSTDSRELERLDRLRHYKNLTVLRGMRLGGSEEIPTLLYEGGTTTERMLEYIPGPLAAVLRPSDIIVADNLAAHKANKVVEALQEYEADIWLLPPYSPDLNPIERLWSKIKTSLRQAKAKTVETLKQAARRALETITNTDIRGWISHSNDRQVD